MNAGTEKNLDERQRMLEGTARTLSGNHALEVIFSETGECKTNFTHMWLPDCHLVDEDIILALMAHELGHLKFTDFESTNAIKRLPNDAEENQAIFNITNVLEDLRIEKLIAETYPGFGRLFLLENARVREELRRVWPALPKINRLLVALYFLMNDKTCDFIEAGYFLAAAYVFRGYENFLDECSDTGSVVRIAIEVFERLKKGLPSDMSEFMKNLRENEAVLELLKEKLRRTGNDMKCPHCGYPVGRGELRCPRCNGEMPESNAGINESGARDAAGGPDDSVASEQLPRPAFDDTVIRISPGEKRDNSRRGPGGAMGRQIIDVSHDILRSISGTVNDEPSLINTKIISCSDIVKSTVRETIAKKRNEARLARKKTFYTAHPMVEQEMRLGRTECQVKPGPDNLYRQIKNSVQKDINFLTSKLSGILDFDITSDWQSGYSSGRKLDRGRLWRIPAGERRLFSKKQTEKEKLSIAFTLLVDESGSMSEFGKTTEARRAAVLFSEALDNFDIPFEVIGYTTKEFDQRHVSYFTPGAAASYNAALPLRHDMFKRFGEKFRNVKTRLTRMDAFYENLDAESLQFAWRRLRQRPEKHRVLIMIFDSLICGGYEARNEFGRIVHEINSTPGAACFGIGIQAPFTGDFFSRFVNIQSANQLGANVVRLIEDCVAVAFRGA